MSQSLAGASAASIGRGELARDVETNAFARKPNGRRPRLVGAEVELIPLTADRRIATVGTGEAGSTVGVLRRVAGTLGWTETVSPKGVRSFATLEGGTVAFEPGGQIEYSAPPCDSASVLLRHLSRTVGALRDAADADGIELLAVGLDPWNSEAPLQLDAERYRRMATYFGTIGDAGARMMRQTAALQISIDAEDDESERWRVANALAPYLVAIFANSPRYGGEHTGCASYRAETWRAVDPRRTGLQDDDMPPAEWYAQFALDAPAMMRPTSDGEYVTFGELADRRDITLAEWREHLSTLFPEVRPRGHLELRSADAIEPAGYAAAIALTTGLLYDPRALRDAGELLGVADADLLRCAGLAGLRSPGIARTACDLADLALSGCRALGEGWIQAADVESASAFFDRYTRRGLSPGDEG